MSSTNRTERAVTHARVWHQRVDAMDAAERKEEEVGRDEGRTWARERATYSELANLDAHWPSIDAFETTEAPPAVFLSVIRGDDFVRPDEIEEFWADLGHDPRGDAHLYSAHFWDGFTEGALEVFDDVLGEL